MSEQQIAKLAGSITEHQSNLSAMSVEDRQWAIQNTTLAIGLFADAVKSRNVKSKTATPFWITIDDATIGVNLGSTPNLPFAGALVEYHIGNGWVVVEKRADGLYINGRKVILYLSRRQQNGKSLKGYELREELMGKPVLNANVLDALYENVHLIPEAWKKDELGNTRYIFFWATLYRLAFGLLFVRYLSFPGGAWHRRYRWLGGSAWRSGSPSASLAN